MYTFLCALLIAGAPSILSAKTLDLFWIDVEGGAATLIITPAGESVLIDSGSAGGRDAPRIVRCLRAAELERIDHLVTTHFHTDHFGGAAEIAALIPIANIYDNGIPEKNPDNPTDTTGSFERSIQPYREVRAKRTVLKPGGTIPLNQTTGPAVSIRCAAAMQKFIEPTGGNRRDCPGLVEKPKDMSDNANSVVLVLQFGSFRMFDGGDLTWNTEGHLVCPTNLVGEVDIYDVNHHGLDVSNNPLLLRALNPTVAIMSNGATKGCGAETFSTLQKTVRAIYQIHRNLRQDSENNTDESRIANIERNCSANFIKVSVAEDARTYTVSIPGKTARIFQTRSE